MLGLIVLVVIRLPIGFQEVKQWTRKYELHHEVFIFFVRHSLWIKGFFVNELWLCKLSHLAVMFSNLNDLKQTLQGNFNTPFHVHDKRSWLSWLIIEVAPEDFTMKEEEKFFMNWIVIQNYVKVLKNITHGFTGWKHAGYADKADKTDFYCPSELFT